MTHPIRNLIHRNRQGEPIALPSVCSAHPDVIAASALLARQKESPLLIEATSNQVNQFGGYTGMRPSDFVASVRDICDRVGLPSERIIFGGDHLGPQAWRAEPPEAAMAKAETLVSEYVRAGFTKIHLDCSEGCFGESEQVPDEVVARRSARLARICEDNAPDPAALVYIVGTEVPPPGGARADGQEHVIQPTSAASARDTLAEHRRCFSADVSEDAWERVVGLVVQPGLEFGSDDIHHFDIHAPDHLSEALTDYPGIAFEAHSTDYQRPDVFADLARRHFAILKVGPALTFSYRKAIYALDEVAGWHGLRGDARLSELLEAEMVAHPGSWRKYYVGEPDDVRRLRHFGYADRIRYYWTRSAVASKVEGLMTRLESAHLAAPLVDQYFAPSVISRAQELLPDAGSLPRALIWSQIQDALEPYYAAGSTEK